MKLLLFLSILALLYSCGSTKEVEEVAKEETIKEEVKPQRNIQLKPKFGDFKDSDPVTINAVRIEENSLFIDISYSGGCKQHNFELIASSVIIKTFPPKRPLQLYHDSNEDVCRELVTNTIEVDIQSLTVNSASGSETVLLLKNWDEEITYIFK